MVSSTRTVPSGDAEANGPVPEAGAGPPRSGRNVPVSLAVILVPAFIGIVRLLTALDRPFAHSGDAAVLETAVRRVSTGTQLLGPYSRFGFHQPGPAYFFVQATFSWLTGGSPLSLFLGALAINFGAAVAAVVVVRRRLGEQAGRWAAVVVAAYLWAGTPALLTDPWNPYVLGTPVLLTILLAATAAAGSWPAAGAAAVVGSFVVQTHLGTGVAVATLFGVAGAVGIAGRRRRDCRPHPPTGRVGRKRAGVAAAGVLLALVWVPPVAEQVRHSPGNLTKLARFFGQSHPEHDAGIDHRLSTASTQVADHLATLPFGRVSNDELPARRAVAGAGILMAAGLGWVGWRRRNLLVAALGGMSLTTSLAAIWSTTRIVGEVLPYLLVWTGVLLLPVWIGLGILVGPALMARDAGRRGLAVSAIVLGGALAWSMLRSPLPPVPDDPSVRAVAQLSRPWLRDRESGQVRVRIGEHDQWPLAAGVIDQLERDGVDVTVDRGWASLFGDQFEPTGRERAELWLTGPASTPPVADRQLLGTVGRASVWAGPLVNERSRG